MPPGRSTFPRFRRRFAATRNDARPQQAGSGAATWTETAPPSSKPENTATVRSLNSLLLVYLGPPLFTAAMLLVFVSWFSHGPADPGADLTSGVRKGGRLGGHSEMFR